MTIVRSGSHTSSTAGRGGKDLRRAVTGCLSDLGDSPQGVADRLRSYGVTGLPGRADDCPMARYLRAVIGSERTVGRVGVLEQRLRVTRRGLRLPFSVTLPPAVRSFVRSFDEGHFPELVDRTVDTRDQGAAHDQPRI
ncbi:MAG TPA: hypothetical protein VFH58_01900 [Acidimicrobiales bacterium]|nr:hypothetical protein [Acidimicrobiales bacterium]